MTQRSGTALTSLPGHPETAPKDTSCFCAACVDAANAVPCMCGHRRDQHYMALVPGNAWPGGCSAAFDTRHPASGGDTLTPCSCKRFQGV